VGGGCGDDPQADDHGKQTQDTANCSSHLLLLLRIPFEECGALR
jgi:hypothetical protein